jgi:hypothetical protein
VDGPGAILGDGDYTLEWFAGQGKKRKPKNSQTWNFGGNVGACVRMCLGVVVW